MLDIKQCPYCDCTDIIFDRDRQEKYCKACGSVLSMPYPYVAGVKVENPLSYPYYTDLKRHIHTPDKIPKEKYGTIGSTRRTVYTHNIPDSKLMKAGVKRRKKHTSY